MRLHASRNISLAGVLVAATLFLAACGSGVPVEQSATRLDADRKERALRLAARGPDGREREAALAVLWPRLRPGMRRADVEDLVGPPSRVGRHSSGAEYGLYYVQSSSNPKNAELMTAEYVSEDGEWVLERVAGPHTPG